MHEFAMDENSCSMDRVVRPSRVWCAWSRLPLRAPAGMSGVSCCGCSAHPSVEIGALTAATTPVAAGRCSSTPSHWPTSVQATSSASLAGHDVVFLALPHGHSAELAAPPGRAARARLRRRPPAPRPAAWAEFYGTPHPGSGRTVCPSSAGQRQAIAGAPASPYRAASPPRSHSPSRRRHPGARRHRDVVVVAATGTSGAGRTPRQDLLGSEVMGSASATASAVPTAILRRSSSTPDGRGERRDRLVHPGPGPDGARNPGHLQRAGRRRGRCRRRARGVR